MIPSNAWLVFPIRTMMNDGDLDHVYAPLVVPAVNIETIPIRLKIVSLWSGTMKVGNILGLNSRIYSYYGAQDLPPKTYQMREVQIAGGNKSFNSIPFILD